MKHLNILTMTAMTVRGLRFTSTAILALALLSACTGARSQGAKDPASRSAGATMPGGASTGTSSSSEPFLRDAGGVDVGNLQIMAVPKTNASVSIPRSWTGRDTNDSLVIQNTSGSVISAARARINDLTSPTAISLQGYLKANHPDRNYRLISVNGLEGVRADYVKTEAELKSDIYLVSETKDFLHFAADLKKADDGIAMGERILLSVRVKYRGEPVRGAKATTITLPAYDFNSPDYLRAAYSFKGDCHSYVGPCPSGNGVAVLFGNGQDNDLEVGVAGYDHGRIIDLGSGAEIPFDDIRIDGEDLVAPAGRVHIADIYTAFTPQKLDAEQDSIELKEGHVYLVRSISWPEEDLITKFKVDKLESTRSVTLTYQKLVEVPKAELQRQVDEINRFTIEHEQPLSSGEVMLYNRSAWNNYYFASFNFKYSTSGNMFITRNGWDLLFEGGLRGEGNFAVPHTGGSLGAVIDVGPDVELASVNVSMYPDPNTYSRGSWESTATVKAGHTYLIYHYDYDGELTYGAVKVLTQDPEMRWVRLKFRRVDIRKADHFQKWTQLAVPEGIQAVELLNPGQGPESTYFPFINKRGDQGRRYYDNISFSERSGSPDYLWLDERPYLEGVGFLALPSGTDLTRVTKEQVEAVRAKLEPVYNIRPGDVVAVVLENYHDKTLAVMRVEAHVPGNSVRLSFRILERAKTSYSEDVK